MDSLSIPVQARQSIFVISLLLLHACSRSPYEGASNYDCQGGDRLILNERLFCVYAEPKMSRPEPQSLAGAEGTAGSESAGSESAGSEMILADDPLYCPPAVPVSQGYETLVICAEEEVSAPLLEAVVAEWGAQYRAQDPTAEDGDLRSDMGMTNAVDVATDAQVTDEESIGIDPLLDYAITE
jgi:hypothetical protein